MYRRRNWIFWGTKESPKSQRMGGGRGVHFYILNKMSFPMAWRIILAHCEVTTERISRLNRGGQWKLFFIAAFQERKFYSSFFIKENVLWHLWGIRMVISCFPCSFCTVKLFHPHYDKRASYIKRPRPKKQKYAKY